MLEVRIVTRDLPEGQHGDLTHLSDSQGPGGNSHCNPRHTQDCVRNHMSHTFKMRRTKSYPSSSSAMLCCCPQAICTIFFSSKPLTGTSAVVMSGQLSNESRQVGFLTGLAFNVKTCPVSCGDMLPRTPVSKLALLSAPACINCGKCEPSSFT
jgi:hypothetical protein